MSVDAVAAVRNLSRIGVKLSPRDRFVLFALADYAHDDFRAWPRHKTLAEFTGYSRDTVLQALASLEAAGLIRSEARRREDGGRSSNIYELVFAEHPPVVTADTPVGETDRGMSDSRTPPVGDSDTPRKRGRHPPVVTADTKNYQKELPEEPRPKPNPPTPLKPQRKKPKGTKVEEHEFDPETVELPPQFDQELFAEFCQARLEKGFPMTLRALKLFVDKHKMHPKPVLDDAFRSAIIGGGWRDLYPKPAELARGKPRQTPEERGADAASGLLEHMVATGRVAP